jgi:hypothetical protein
VNKDEGGNESEQTPSELEAKVSRRMLFKTGGAVVAGAGLAGLAGAGVAGAALPLPFASGTTDGLKIAFKGDLATVTSNIEKAYKAKAYGTSAVLGGICDSLIAENGGLAAVGKSDFTLSFDLSFDLSWPF